MLYWEFFPLNSSGTDRCCYGFNIIAFKEIQSFLIWETKAQNWWLLVKTILYYSWVNNALKLRVGCWEILFLNSYSACFLMWISVKVCLHLSQGLVTWLMSSFINKIWSLKCSHFHYACPAFPLPFCKYILNFKLLPFSWWFCLCFWDAYLPSNKLLNRNCHLFDLGRKGICTAVKLMRFFFLLKALNIPMRHMGE